MGWKDYLNNDNPSSNSESKMKWKDFLGNTDKYKTYETNRATESLVRAKQMAIDKNDYTSPLYEYTKKPDTNSIFVDDNSISKANSNSKSNTDTGFWANIRANEDKITNNPLFKAFQSIGDLPYKLPFTQRILKSAGDTVAGKGAMVNDDGTPMESKDTGSKIGNVAADIIGTGLGYSMPMGGLGNGGTTNTFQGVANEAINGAIKPVEKYIPQATNKLGEYGLNALKSGLEFGGLNAVQSVAQGQNTDDTIKSGLEGALSGAIFGTAVKGLGDIKSSAFPEWKTTFESVAPEKVKPKENILNTDIQSIINPVPGIDTNFAKLKPGTDVLFNNKPFKLGEMNTDGQFDLLNSNGKPVLSTTLDNLKLNLNELDNIKFGSAAREAAASSNSGRELRAEKNKLIRDYVDFIDSGKVDQAESLNKRISEIDDILGEKSPLPDTIIAKDKNKPSLNRETFDRNLEGVFPNDSGTFKSLYSDPIKSGEAESIRFKNKLRDEVRNLKLTSKESELVQKYGEGKLSIQELQNMQGVDFNKIKTATDYFKSTYKNLLNTANDVLTKNGYRPMAERANYFPHFEELNPIMKALGIQNPQLPTDINGLTADFSPGKTFFNNALQRKGDKTVFDAVRGFDNYLEGIGNVIYHTDNIQRIRSLERDIRTVYKDKTELTNFVSYLHEYGNTLAGKKSELDRGTESAIGRPVYKLIDFVRKQTGANMVGANISSALTNFVPLTQAISTTNKADFAKGLVEAFKNTIPGLDDGFYKKSDFLTRRFGSDKLYQTKVQKVSESANLMFKAIDKFVSESIVRSKYYENLKKGIPDKLAIKDADTWAARIMADRSLGQVPPYFNSKVIGTIFQFQLEVNNQISYLFKDLPKEKLKNGFNPKSAAALANTATQVALFSYLFNNIYEKATGRRPAFDVLGVAEQSYNDFKGKEFPLTTALNKVPIINNFTNPTPKITEPLKKDAATKNLIENISNQLPFTSILTGGRLPINSALPSISKLYSGSANVKTELTNPLYYLFFPTGGGQIKKTLDGLSAINNKGVYNKDGTQLNYPIDDNTSNKIKAITFGKSSLPETQEFYANDRKPLSEDQTKLLRAVIGQDTPNKIQEKQIKDEKLNGKTAQEIYSKILNERAINKIKDAVYNYRRTLEESDIINKTSSKYVQDSVNTVMKNKNYTNEEKVKQLQDILKRMKNKYE